MAKESIQAPGSSLGIVIFGKTGTGKSTLINSLFAKHLAEEGHHLYPKTDSVGQYTQTITMTMKNVRVTLWDTPGLKNPFSDGEKTIKEISNKCGNPEGIHLFVYCTSFNQRRLEDGDIVCIQHITKAFGSGIWSRALFALTFADEAKVPKSDANKVSLPEYFQSRIEEWGKMLNDAVKMIVKQTEGVEISGQVKSIPVVPTCYINFNGDRMPSLPDGRIWYLHFWSACLAQVKYFAVPSMKLVVNDLVKDESDRTEMERMCEERTASGCEIADKVQVVNSSANHGATTPSSAVHGNEPTIQGTTTSPSGQERGPLTASTVDSTTNGDFPDGSVAAKSCGPESTDGNNAQDFVGKKLTSYLDMLAEKGIGGCMIDVKGDLEAHVGKELKEENVQKTMEKIDLDISEAEITSLNVNDSPLFKQVKGRVKLENFDDEDDKIPYGPVVIAETESIEKWKEKTRGWSIAPTIGVSHYGNASGTFTYSRGTGEKLVERESSATSVTHQRNIKVKPGSSRIVAVEVDIKLHVIHVKNVLLEFTSDTKLKTKCWPWSKQKLSKILEIRSEKDGKIIAVSDGKVEVMEVLSAVRTYTEK